MKYILKFPKGVEVDVFNPPKDFDEQIRKSFAEYTKGTSSEYTYQDKLSYIDLINKYAHKVSDSYTEIEDYIKETFCDRFDCFGEFTSESDFQTVETLVDVYELGRIKLYDTYGDDHHIWDKVMELIARAIKVVMNFEYSEVKE